MAKTNCWEYTKCGREAGGEKVDELGVCIAAAETKANGTHGGVNGGRACWAIAGTLCEGEVQGSYARKFQDCMLCDFYKKVMEEEGSNAISGTLISSMLELNSL